MKSGVSERRIVVLLMAALVFESLLLLWHMGMISFGEAGHANGDRPAGVVARVENELRRRSSNSLVWEKSQSQEAVYYYDSVLTLSQSTAVLKLGADSEVELSENTLVTIEPQENATAGEIRLKFTRGGLQARNPFANTRIQAENFTVDLSAGSEMQLRQTAQNEYEVQVSKGGARVESRDGYHEITARDLLRVSNGAAHKLSLDQSLAWVEPPARRLYTHEENLELDLRWKGTARELRIQSKNGEQTQVLAEGAAQARVKLPLGRHVIYLRDQERSGPPLEIQIWKAPMLHLISPLPRNRMRTDVANLFLWTRIPDASEYRFSLRGSHYNIEKTTATNVLEQTFSEEDDAEWDVWAKDSRGFVIPPLYKYPVFIRHQPFAPPKLKSPQMRAPAQEEGRGAWLIDLLLPRAYAEESAKRFETVFSWEPVEGANRYWIEISETPDFRAPIVNTHTSRTEFVWRLERSGQYYWRVAAGNKQGRMGEFSEPAKVEFHEMPAPKPVANTKVAEPVAPAPAPAPAPAAAPVAAAAPAVSAAPAPEPAAEGKPHGLRVFWRGGYGLIQAKEDQQVSASLRGTKMTAGALEYDFARSADSWWTLEAKYARWTFKPDPEDEYPFQDDLPVQQGEVKFTGSSSSRALGFGFSLAVAPKITREGMESVRVENGFLAGAHARGRWSLRFAEYTADFGLAGGTLGYGINTAHRLMFAPTRRLMMGLGAEGTYLMRSSNRNLSADGMFLFGFQF